MLEVIAAARKITGNTIDIKIEPRRSGDPARLIADAKKAFAVLGWKPEYATLETILSSAWDWKQAHTNGYTN